VITDNTVLASAETSIDPDTQELYVKGPSLFQGYLSNGLLTLPLNKAGFFNTKDRICFKNGDFQYLGRQDRLIISGGENIQPEEIETVLLKHPKVHRAAVVGIPDKTFGERPIAFLETDDIPSIRAEIEALLESLPKFKRPDKFLPLPNIGATEKISFKNLRIYGQNTI
jgi:O-succinylbenzoic acid--CoA ligase